MYFYNSNRLSFLWYRIHSPANSAPHTAPCRRLRSFARPYYRRRKDASESKNSLTRFRVTRDGFA